MTKQDKPTMKIEKIDSILGRKYYNSFISGDAEQVERSYEDRIGETLKEYDSHHSNLNEAKLIELLAEIVSKLNELVEAVNSLEKGEKYE